MKSIQFFVFFCFIFHQNGTAQQTGKCWLKDDFSQKTLANHWKIVERGTAKVENGVLRLDGAMAVAGDSTWKNYELKFRARTPPNVRGQQIWAGIRYLDRDQRYAFALRAAPHDDLWLARFGYLGTDDFLALRPLDFSPRLDTGWQTVRLQIFGDCLSVWLNDETLPRIQIQDSTRWLPGGGIVLGGGWLPIEFDDVEVHELLSQNIDFQELKKYDDPASKLKQRATERAQFQIKTLAKLPQDRAETNLNGEWLFLPNYQFDGKTPAQLADPTLHDSTWHVLKVPQFWNEHRVWLHGEDAMMLSGDKGVSDNFRQQDQVRCEAFTFDFRRTESAMYRQWLKVEEAFFRTPHTFLLQFDAISKIGEIWVNGHFVGRHVGMFGEFTADISAFLKSGSNLIAVHVIRNYQLTSADALRVEDVAVTVEITKKMLTDLPHGIFTKDPAGIWQPVRLLVTAGTTFLKDVFFKPHLNGADIFIESNFQNLSAVNPSHFEYQVKLTELPSGKLFYQKTYPSLSEIYQNSIFDTISINNIQPKLWSPEQPNLYRLDIILIENDRPIDRYSHEVGFRTFEVRGDFFYLNKIPYRMRGANHSPMSIRPNDSLLAHQFFQWMHRGGMVFTRTTTSPFSKIWMQAADREGVAVSFEGQWPWLMMRGNIPNDTLLQLWQAEFFNLLKKYRNHPSLLLWTVNNEMKFYEKDTDRPRVEQKFRIISEVVRQIRRLDGTRPVIFDSGYRRDSTQASPAFIQSIDDGDADDVHSYINWYYYSIFDYFNGEFSRWYKNLGRPLISQEFSSGYPNNDNGHAVRFYPFAHYVGQSQLGRYIFEDHDPRYFLDFQAFISKEGHEAVRRTCPDVAGLQQFSSICWFRNVFDAQKMQPYPTYFQMKLALQPVLVSAELWGRHFYTGDTLRTRVAVLNDAADGSTLPPTNLHFWVEVEGKKVVSGRRKLPPVAHFSRNWQELEIVFPKKLSSQKVNAQLKFELRAGKKTISKNEYNLLLVQHFEVEKNWQQHVQVEWLDPQRKYQKAWQKVQQHQHTTLQIADNQKFRKIWLADADFFQSAELEKIRPEIEQGGRLILIGDASKMQGLFPEVIDSVFRQAGEIVSWRKSELPIFQHIEPEELRWWTGRGREKPLICRNSIYTSPRAGVEPLLQFTVVHGYINPAYHVRHERVREFTGYPLVRVRMGAGEVFLCTLMLEKAATDPVAGRFLHHLIALPSCE